ncbi:MAG: hypothetical protein MUE74_08575 [Bacteroidales bacterium]|nr:hypothetical protein [Bacteroidales bacterium]
MELYLPAALHLLLSAGSILFFVRVRKAVNGNSEIQTENPGWKKILPAALISASGAAVTVMTIINFRFVTSNKPDSDPGLQAFSSSIFNTGKDGFLLPFIILALIATAALIVYQAVKNDRIENKTINTGKKQHRNE